MIILGDAMCADAEEQCRRYRKMGLQGRNQKDAAAGLLAMCMHERDAAAKLLRACHSSSGNLEGHDMHRKYCAGISLTVSVTAITL